MQSELERLQPTHNLHIDFVHEAVRQQADLHPDRTALIDDGGRQITYRELVERADHLAQHLRSLGVKPDDCVAVLLDRSVEQVVSMVATLAAGAVYVPIDTSYPEARIAGMFQNICLGALITDRDVLRGIASDVPVVHPTSGTLQTTEAPAPELTSDHLAYVVYTSGSTGVPKGVAMTHRGLSRLIKWQVADSPPGLTTLHFTAPGFDVTFQEVFSTLCSGGTLVQISEEARRDPERLLNTLIERNIERLFLPYVALQNLARASQRLGIVPRSLRHVITAGERLVITEAISDLFKAMPGCRLHNHYGPTEAHLVTSYTLSEDPTTWPAVPPIGSAVIGVTLYNLNDAMEPVPTGELGELYIGGDCLARGYLNSAALTEERFLPDPFQPGSGERIYKSGDVVRIDEEGVVHFVGRSDDQIKVRGFRVEPAEIELTLTDHPDVSAASVGLRTIAEEVNALVAYVVCSNPEVTAADLSKHVRSLLPAYMVPARFVMLDTLPLTATGKVDRLALSEIALPEAEVTEVPADEPLADRIRAIWERVLGHDDFAEDDDFFDVGGDSLLAAWVVTELSQTVGRDVDLSVLLQDSTIEDLARALEQDALKVASAPQASEVITLRAGSLQRALFFAHQLGGEVLPYRELARAIKSPLRVLGLRWRPDAVNPSRPIVLEEMAATHVASIRAIQPSGPYLLAGWSFGGVLAYEIAQQLVAGGERVDFLGMLDANPVLDPIYGVKTSEDPHFAMLTKVLGEMDRSLERGEADGDVSHLFADSAWNALLGDTVPEGVTAAHLRKNLELAHNCVRAAMNYHPAPYSGAIDLFQSSETAPALKAALEDALRGMALGTMRVHEIPGDHSSILRAPSVETMARAIDQTLDSI